MSGAVEGAGAMPAVTATDGAGTPNQEAWNAATAAGGGASAAQKAETTEMMGQIEQVMMMPLIQQAMNAGQDDD